MKPLLFFDIEVYPNTYFAVFCCIDLQITVVNWDEGLPEEFLFNYQMVGFNSNFYDDAIIDNWGVEPSVMKGISDSLINNGDIFYKRYSMDVLRQLKNDPTIGVGCPGLKEIEFNRGKLPTQTPIPFNEPLPEHMLGLAVEYCTADVMELMEIVTDKKQLFDTLFYLHENYNFNLSKTVASNVDALFTHTKTVHETDSWRERLDMLISEIELFGDKCPQVVSGDGGVHAALSAVEYDNVMNFDVASQYPSIIINLGLLGEKTDIFKRIRDQRVAMKETDPIVAGALKIVLNTVYGVLNGDKGFFKSENKSAGLLTCLYGQYSILWLTKLLLARGAQIIQINTDGVMFTALPERVLNEVQEEWERMFHMQIELDLIDKVIQKDVNNYIAVFQDGHVKTKGGDLGNAKGRRIYRKNTNVVLDKMVYNILLGRGIEQDIEPYDYARFVRPSSAYPVLTLDGVEHTEGLVVMPWDETGLELWKHKPDGAKSRFTNLECVKLFDHALEVPWSVRAAHISMALDKVYGRLKKNGEPYAGSTAWKRDTVTKTLYEKIILA